MRIDNIMNSRHIQQRKKKMKAEQRTKGRESDKAEKKVL